MTAPIQMVHLALRSLLAAASLGAQEYAVEQPTFAKLMAVANTDRMLQMTDAEIEDTWGENGAGGDAAGVKLSSLGQFDRTRGSLEQMVSPAHACIYLKKWQSTHKAQLLNKTNDELEGLSKHAINMK